MSNLEELFKAEREAREAADAEVSAAEEQLRPGDFCARHIHGFVVISEILDHGQALLAGRDLADLDEEEREEYDDVLDCYQQPHMRNYRFTRSYSVACPEGELGDIHIAHAVKIPEELFLKIKGELTQRV